MTGVRMFVAGLALSALHPGASTQAQCKAIDSDENVLVLSQIAVSEAGFGVDADHVAIFAVLCDVRARGRRKYGKPLSIAWAGRRYSPHATGEASASTSRQVWIRNLNLSGTKPEGWPQHLSWDAHRARWAKVLWRSRSILRGESRATCSSPPHHWGGAMDRPRAVRAGFVRVDCGDTKNDFWRYPGKPVGARLASGKAKGLI